MTNAELIAKIKAEIERRKSLLTQHSKLTYDLIIETFIKEYDSLLSFLSTLESENPVPKDLEEAARKYKSQWNMEHPHSPDIDFIAGAKWQENKDQETIRLAEDHAFLAGADWQKEQMPLPEDTVLFNKGVEEGKRLMMEDAVEGEFLYTPYPTIALDDCKDYDFKEGDKVRIIIVKEN